MSAIQPTPKPFKVRRAAPGDEPVLRELRLQALAESPDAFCSTRERELARTVEDWGRWISPGFTFILEEGGVARGLVSGRHDAEDSALVHLMSMWVHPALRGCGAADALAVEHLNWSRAAGAKVVRLDIIATNERAHRLYERHGFRPTGPATVRDGDCRSQIRMERSLSA